MNQFLGRMWFRLRTDNNWRWIALAMFTLLLLVVGISMIPYTISQPDNEYTRAQREVYNFASELRQRWGSTSLDYDRGTPGLARSFGLLIFGCLGVAMIATLVYFFFAFSDEFASVLESVRTKMWDKYGSEIVDKRGLTQLLLGKVPPRGAAPAPAPTGPAQQGKPLTRGTFLLWEAVFNIISEFAGDVLWRGRR